jgi:hypothetical protein
MAVLSCFYGVVVLMYPFDDALAGHPHLHARCGGDEALVALGDGTLLAGRIPGGKLRLVQAWIEIHRDVLNANWALALAGEELFRVAPLA